MPLSQHVKIGLIAVAIFLLDFVSKLLTHLYLPLMSYSPLVYPYGGIGIFKNILGVEFSLSHTTNRGAAWGIFAHFQHYLLIFRIFLVILLIGYFFLHNEARSRRMPLALIVVGALGNVLDNFVYGHVVDMFHFVLWGYDFPVFNVADAAIFLGISWWVGLSLWNKSLHQVDGRAS